MAEYSIDLNDRPFLFF